MYKIKLNAALTLLFFPLFSPLYVHAVDVNQYPVLQQLVKTMAAQDGFPASELQQILSTANIDPATLKLMDKQWESLPWHKYQKLFINDNRINAGVKFWQTHHKLLQRAQQEYGISQEIIVALIGVETHYGTRIGDKRVLDSLVTLSAAYPRRSKFFTKELRTFLNMTKSEGIEPGSVVGSFAGAIGIPQFMPSSYQAYSVDFNDNGQRDLVNETADAIGSVANYLSVHGWQRNAPIFAAVSGTPADDALKLLSKKAKPKHNLDVLIQSGLKFDPSGGSKKATLLKLTEENASRYFIGYINFYAITRYNPSINYAMAVTELSQEIRALRAKNNP